MANVTAVSVQFKADALAILTGMSIKAALYLTTGSISGTTLTYSSTSEVSGTNYTAGGVAVTNANAVATSGTTAYWTPSANITYSTVTLSTAFDTVLLYNTANSHAIGSWNFGSTTITAGNLTLTMPVNASATALIQQN